MRTDTPNCNCPGYNALGMNHGHHASCASLNPPVAEQPEGCPANTVIDGISQQCVLLIDHNDVDPHEWLPTLDGGRLTDEEIYVITSVRPVWAKKWSAVIALAHAAEDKAWHSRDAEVNGYQGSVENQMKRADAADAEVAQLDGAFEEMRESYEGTVAQLREQLDAANGFIKMSAAAANTWQAWNRRTVKERDAALVQRDALIEAAEKSIHQINIGDWIYARKPLDTAIAAVRDRD